MYKKCYTDHVRFIEKQTKTISSSLAEGFQSQYPPICDWNPSANPSNGVNELQKQNKNKTSSKKQKQTKKHGSLKKAKPGDG